MVSHTANFDIVDEKYLKYDESDNTFQGYYINKIYDDYLEYT